MAILVAANFDDAEWATWWPLLKAALPGETLVRDRRRKIESVRRAAVETRVGGDTAVDDTDIDMDIDIAIVANPPPGSLRGLPGLRLIQSLWAGVDRLLADPSVPIDAPLARMVDPAMNDSMAQTVLWAALSLHRCFFDYAAQQREAKWRQHPLQRADETVIAVLGLGEMGRSSARLLAAHGYRVIGWSRSAAAIDGVATYCGDAALSGVLASAQIVVNLLPLTERTRGLFDSARFAQMQRGTSFVNLARGAHVVEGDLLAELDDGHLHRAVLDVFAQEPLPAGHAFWSHPSIVMLPHVAAQTDARSAAAIAARNVLALREGRALEHLVDRSLGY